MKTVSSLELSYLVKEFEFLINARVDKIYAPRKKEIILQLFVSGKGKYFLKIDEKSVYLSDYKPISETPSDFCMILRKKIGSARLRKIEQLGFERIISFEFETKDTKVNLIAELFSRGNIILTRNKKIIVAAEYQNWKDRVLRPNAEYIYPKRDHNFFELDKKEFKEILENTNKENIVKCLAIELGLGGVYAEEACLLAGIDKDKKPDELKDDEIDKLVDSFKKLKQRKIEPRIIYKKNDIIDIVPFEMKFYNKLNQEKAESYSKILDEYFSKEELIIQKERANKDIDKINEIIKSQKKDIKRLEKQEEENKEKGEIIYQNYKIITDIISELKKISEKHSWKDIKKKLKGHELIKEVIPTEKSIIIDIK